MSIFDIITTYCPNIQKRGDKRSKCLPNSNVNLLPFKLVGLEGRDIELYNATEGEI